MKAQVKTADLQVPRRQQLLEQMELANRWCIPWLVLQSALAVGLAFLVDWRNAGREPWLVTIAIAALVGPYAMSLLKLSVRKRKEVGELKEQTRFGAFDKHRLRSLFEDTLKRLGLPMRRIPVYIVADKSLNAMMLHNGLGGLFNWLNGIYLHRQTLHKLKPEEIQALMGHELGHYYRYYLLADRFRILSLLLAALIALVIVQWTGFDGLISTLAIMLWAGVFWWITSFRATRLAWAQEYLCDDLGAQVHGVVVSINGLMKIGAEWEVLTAVQRQAVLSSHSENLNAQEICDAIDRAIPYGHATRQELETAIEKTLKQRAQQGPSLAGFLRYLWQSDVDAHADEELEAEMKKLRALAGIPRIPWESLLREPRDIEFDDQSLAALMELIDGFPSAALFHIPEALGELHSSHPPLKRRIQYLWQNRTAIEGGWHR